MTTNPEVLRLARPNMEMCMCPLHTMFPQRIADLIEPTYDDLKAACDLIGKDSYGKLYWTPDTISPCNNVVQAFARHRVRYDRQSEKDNSDAD